MSEADGFEKDAFSGNWRASGLDIQEKNEFAEQGRALTQEQQEEEKMDTTVSEKYDADQIQVLEGWCKRGSLSHRKKCVFQRNISALTLF